MSNRYRMMKDRGREDFGIRHCLFGVRYSITAVLIGIISLSASAQVRREQPEPLPGYTSLARANVGFSTWGFFASLANHVGVVANINVTSNPALQLAYTYRVHPRVSVGLGLSRQVFAIRYRNYEYQGEGGVTLLDNFTTYIRRFNAGALALFHYNPNGQVQLYSGGRVGISRWSFDTNAADINYTLGRFVEFALGTQFAPQLILLGGNTYFTEHVGANFELGIGAPHLFSVGVGYRW